MEPLSNGHGGGITCSEVALTSDYRKKSRKGSLGSCSLSNVFSSQTFRFLWQSRLGGARYGENPKDFQSGRQCIETKTHRGGTMPTVAISSEHQLDDSDLDNLFLIVLPVIRSGADSAASFTVTDLATQLQSRIIQQDPSSLEDFESRLSSVGFHWEDDYSDVTWLVGSWQSYRVAGDFPRLTAREAMLGIRQVSYTLSLNACDAFRITDAEIDSAIRRG